MKINLKYTLFVLMLIGSYKFNFANIVFHEEDKLKNISSQLLLLEDKNNSVSIDNVSEFTFMPSKQKIPNFGFSSSTFWVKIEILNKSNSEDLMLEISNPILDNIEFFHPSKNGYKSIKSGENFPFYQRKYDDPNYLFDLTIPKDSSKEFYLKVSGSEAIQLPINIGLTSHIESHINNRNFLSGIYCGVMLVMILYNLFLYFSVKDRSYIYYVVYIILILLTQTNLQGYPFKYLWPNLPIIAKYSLFIFPSLVGIASLVFMNVFLKVKSYSKLLFNFTFLFTLIYFISITSSFFNLFEFSQKLMEINAMVVSIFMLATSIIIVKKGYQPAKYFLAAWSVFLIGVIVFVLKDVGVLPFNNITRYTMQIGSGIETVLLSFALAARINIYKKERLEALKEKERVVREQNIVLEEKVKERTKELNQALINLKQTQSQLVDAEKMSSLGQLTAGIAHEINNPINFVSSSISPLRRDIKDIESIIKKYEEINVSDNLEEKLKEVEALKQEIDYEYIKAELETIINSIQDGAERTKEIVSSLRNFSRLDEIELQKADVNEGIESTLILLKNKLNGITLSKDLVKLPIIECYPSKLNQAFMNLIDNAIGAIKEKNLKSGDGSIEIKTHFDDDFIYINIKDNGVGIDEKIKDKIFDPFFTTKDVGKGTGLGLSIVYSIIESHNGDIIVNSKKNEGSEFIIKIPNKRG